MSGPSVRVQVRFRTCRHEGLSAPRLVETAPSPIARRVALAHAVDRLTEDGSVTDYADAARRLGVTRARLTQICDLALLAPRVQEAVLLGEIAPSDRQLRELGRHLCWQDQRRAFHHMFPELSPTHENNDND